LKYYSYRYKLQRLKRGGQIFLKKAKNSEIIKMTEIVTLTAELRSETGTGSSRALRKRGMVPATIYGAKNTPISVAVEEKEITKYYRRPQYISQLFELEIDKKKYKVLPKAIQLHPITEVVNHADFVFLEDKMQKMQVPVVYTNKENCLGVKRGGYFNTVKRALTILCPIDRLPRKIEIDVTNLPIAASLKAKQAPLPEGATLLENPEFVIASIVGRKGKADSMDDEAAAGAEGADAGNKEQK
jgi:large subunit ribosomal protein L25